MHLCHFVETSPRLYGVEQQRLWDESGINLLKYHLQFLYPRTLWNLNSFDLSFIYGALRVMYWFISVRLEYCQWEIIQLHTVQKTLVSLGFSHDLAIVSNYCHQDGSVYDYSLHFFGYAMQPMLKTRIGHGLKGKSWEHLRSSRRRSFAGPLRYIDIWRCSSCYLP